MAPSTVQETVTVTAEAPLLNVSDVEPWRQRRPGAGAGAAGIGPQLDGAGDARARQPDDESAARRHCPIAIAGEQREFQFSQPRRSAGRAVNWDTVVSRDTSAGFDRANSSSSRTGSTRRRDVHRGVQVEGDDPLGHEHAVGFGPRQFPDILGSTPRTQCSTASCRSTTSSSRLRLAVRSAAICLHYFGHFEYEREPRTSVWNTPFPRSTSSWMASRPSRWVAAALDYQLSPQTAHDGQGTPRLASGSRSAPATTSIPPRRARTAT